MERRRAARARHLDDVDLSESTIAKGTKATPTPAPPTTRPNKESEAEPSRFPYGMRGAGMAYSSSISTAMDAYDDLAGHHLLSIRNLIATSPGDSYLSTSTDEASQEDPEWDYLELRDYEAFVAFQAAADYCFDYSDDSSTGDHDPARECFVAAIFEPDTEDNGPVTPRDPVGSAAPRQAAPPATGDAALVQAQLIQVRELEASLEDERRQVRWLRAALETGRPGPSNFAQEVARTAQARIMADDHGDDPLALARTSQKLIAAATLIRAMPVPSTPQGRNMRREAQALIEQAAVQWRACLAERKA